MVLLKSAPISTFVFADEETVYDADLCAPAVRTVELLEPNEGSKSIITVLMQGWDRAKVLGCSFRDPCCHWCFFRVDHCVSKCREKRKKELFFKYFLLVFLALIMHTDGETLGFILIYIQSSFFASPPTQPPLKCISWDERPFFFRCRNNFINLKTAETFQHLGFGECYTFIQLPRGG